MTARFVGQGGSDANNGLTWQTRKLTLNGVEDSPVVAGDIVYVGAGTYRELLTIDVSGGNVATGSAAVTASVTQGSPIVIGNGTTWLSTAAPDYIFHTPILANGADGVTTNVTGTSHAFASTAGNFQSGHIGQTIRISTIGAYVIKTVVGATSITVGKADNSSFVMAAGTALSYNVGPEQPYDILSVDSDTQITLKKPWSAASFTGITYTTYNPIRYVGDYAGENTDGIGGVVRVTGSDNDQTATRANCITATTKNYRMFSGFLLDTTTGTSVNNNGGTYWIIEKCCLQPTSSSAACISLAATTAFACTIQICIFVAHGANHCISAPNATVTNAAHLVQNCIFSSGLRGLNIDRVGGILIRNCVFQGVSVGVSQLNAFTSPGQAETVNNCTFQGCATGVQGNSSLDVIEDFNAFFGNSANRSNVLTGANSKTYPPLLDSRWFFQLINARAGSYSPTQMVTPFDLSSFSQLINLAGFNPAPTDMRGTAIQNTQREWGALEYDSTLSIKARQASSIDGGGMVA